MSDHDHERLHDLLKKLAEAQAGGLHEAQWESDFEHLVAARFEAAEIGTEEDREAKMLERLHGAIRNRTAKSSRDRSPRWPRRKWIGFAVAGATACLLWIAFALMQSPLPPGQKVGVFAIVRGEPKISRIGEGGSNLVATNGAIRLGTRIETSAGESFELRFDEGTRMRVAANSIIEIPRSDGSNSRLVLQRPPIVTVLKGRAWADVRPVPGLPKFSIKTSFATAEALGTEFGVEVRELSGKKAEEAVLVVLSGRVHFFNKLGSVEATAGTTCFARAGFAPSLSKPRRNYTFTSLGGFLYAIGGGSHSTSSSVADVEAYDPSSDSWTGLAPLLYASQQLAAGTIDGIIYAVGGCTAQESLSTLQAYDPATNKWTIKASMPTARTGVSATTVGGKLYVLGGGEGFGGPTYPDLVEAYDPATDSWTKIPPVPTARSAMGVGTLDGKLFTVGGGIPGKKKGDPGVALGTVEVYDPRTNSWSSHAPLPAPKVWPTIGVLNGTLYAVGGIYMDRWTNTVQAYDPKKNSWRTLTPSPVAFESNNGGNAAVHEGTLYILGRVPHLELNPGEPEGGQRFFQGSPGVASFTSRSWSYSDGDGLLNADEERLYRTDPRTPDSDRDGIADGIEVWYGTDPSKADTDGDHVMDWEDPSPLDRGVIGSRIVGALRDLADQVGSLHLSFFQIDSISEEAARKRRTSLSEGIKRAAQMVASGNRKGAMEWLWLQVRQDKRGGQPMDWMANGEEKAAIATEIQMLSVLLRPR